jgi:hypothetical protein
VLFFQPFMNQPQHTLVPHQNDGNDSLIKSAMHTAARGSKQALCSAAWCAGATHGKIENAATAAVNFARSEHISTLKYGMQTFVTLKNIGTPMIRAIGVEMSENGGGVQLREGSPAAWVSSRATSMVLAAASSSTMGMITDGASTSAAAVAGAAGGAVVLLPAAAAVAVAGVAAGYAIGRYRSKQ